MADQSARTRARIAEQAARLIAENGIHDYALAKRKAARQLGLPEGNNLPRNDEIDAALMERQALFEPEEQAAALEMLRNQALEVMRVFARFEPVLTGGVVTGAVSEHSQIELDLNAESSKDFEQFLLNRSIEFKILDRAGRMAYLIYSEPADVIVRVLSVEPYNIPGGARARLTLPQLERILAPA